MKKLILLALIAIVAFSANAQVVTMYNPGTTYSLARLQTTSVTRDTVTNTGTGYVNCKILKGDGAITIQATVTKVSGTVAGALQLWGSIDGVAYSILNTIETQTAVASATATDTAGSKAYTWRFASSPFLYYRIVHTGTGTMVSYLDGVILKR